MFETLQNCSLSRRECISLGGIALSMSIGDLLQAKNDSTANTRRFGQAKSCVVVFQFGGPGQQDLWDLKPDGPVETRGEFKPIDTNVPGILISEHLPHLSKQTDKFTIVRSVSHTDFEHGSASYTALTGHPHPLPGTNTPARPEDFPTYGSVVSLLNATEKPVPSAAVLGPVMHQGNRPPMAGQNAGFLGAAYEPFRIPDDPSADGFRVTGLSVPEDVTPSRIETRGKLLKELDGRSLRGKSVEAVTQYKQRVHGLLSSSHSRRAFNLEKEAAAMRDVYGRHKFGQTMLLARRLVEAEIPLITVNWSKLNADQWDTHKSNYPTLKTKLLPPFDQGMAAFLNDLDQRGLLDSTLVIALGEFGRTPKINKDAGRDHWPDCYSVLMAGGGIRRGFIFGSSDRNAAYPTSSPVAPWDVAATMYHLLGVNPQTDVHDRLNRPFRLSQGRVVEGLIGT